VRDAIVLCYAGGRLERVRVRIEPVASSAGPPGFASGPPVHFAICPVTQSVTGSIQLGPGSPVAGRGRE
jgi:hypothetical protein